MYRFIMLVNINFINSFAESPNTYGAGDLSHLTFWICFVHTSYCIFVYYLCLQAPRCLAFCAFFILGLVLFIFAAAYCFTSFAQRFSGIWKANQHKKL